MTRSRSFLLLFVFLFSSLILPADGLAGKILETEKKLYSQHNEELIIRDFFNDMKNGVFLDIGCNHYMERNNTFYLEKHLAWSGIGIDAIPLYKEGYDQNRPKTKFLHYAVTDHSGTSDPFYVSMSTFDVSSLDPNYVYKYGPKSVKMMVPTITMDKMLEEQGIQQVDFLSMDIEDGEPAALRGFTIQKYKPKLVCIEAHETVRPFLIEYFEKNGYVRIPEYDAYDNVNWYYKPKTQ